MLSDLQKADIMAHFWKFIFLYHCVLCTKSFVINFYYEYRIAGKFGGS